MFGLLFKLASVIILGIGITKFAPDQFRHFPPQINIASISGSLKNIDYGNLAGKISQSLDNLVTHPGRSPVVLGLEITNESLKTIANTLSGLPPDQLEQIKQYICQPSTQSAENE
jgi:hypothetical protein